MKKLLLATTAVFALATDSSIAADLSRPVLKAAPMAPPCAAARFQGGYVGVSGGGVNYEANRTALDGFLFDATATNVAKKWGGIVGAQAGYNWTTCNTLWGIEVDGSWVGAKATTRLFPEELGGEVSVTSRFDTLVTGRVRTGLVLDNLLLYVTGGVAGAHFKTDWINSFDGFASATIKEWRWGWTAGFGTEWAWTPNVSLKSEVLYVDFVDRDHRVLFNPGNFAFNFKHSDSAWISRVGLNVKFGGPVVAKY